MWIHLPDEDLKKTAEILRAAGELQSADKIIHFLEDNAGNKKDYDRYREAAREQLGDEDNVDHDAVVSTGDDPGAYVACWHWVRNADADILSDGMWKVVVKVKPPCTVDNVKWVEAAMGETIFERQGEILIFTFDDEDEATGTAANLSEGLPEFIISCEAVEHTCVDEPQPGPHPPGDPSCPAVQGGVCHILMHNDLADRKEQQP